MLIFSQKNSWKKLLHQGLFQTLSLVMLFALHLASSPASAGNHTGMQKDELPVIRAIQVDLDYVYDPDPGQQKANLDLLVRRVRRLGINTIFLQAFADPDGNGIAESLYFANRFLPLREDLFAPAAQALRQNGVAVYGWLPLLAYKLPGQNNELYVRRIHDSGSPVQPLNEYLRLSPFNSQAKRIIEGIYRDFAQQTAIDGILFHDDGILSDFEDSSNAALRQYGQAGFPSDIATIRNSRATMRKWSRYKTNYLIDFSLSLLEIIRQQQPGVRSARNIFAGPVLQPESEEWFAQSLPLFLQAYDYTALMAMPFMEKAAEPDRWLEQLAWAALDPQKKNNRLIFELQTKNWLTNKPIPADVLQRHILLLSQMGVTSFAFYPDDFHNDMPPADMIKSCLSSPATCAEEVAP